MLLLLCTLSWSAETPQSPNAVQLSSASRSLAEAEYRSRSLQLEPSEEGFRVLDGRGRTLDPQVFAKRSEDWWTWQRIDYQERLSRTVVSSFYLVGGLSALVGANIVPLVASGFIKAGNPGHTLTRLRRMFMRHQLDETEVQIMRGALKHFAATVVQQSDDRSDF